MKLLLLGGPNFLGYHLIDAALASGHDVTVFNRGQTGSDLYPTIEKLVGDRDGNLKALEDRQWDVVIDTCGYLPRLVRDSARLLADAVDRYIFVSSISVYAELDRPGLDEMAPQVTLENPAVEEITGETYGGLKSLCEQAVEDALPGRTLSIRPGLIVGPRDPTDRFTYWPSRIAHGGEVLAPVHEAHPVQIIDVRDLAGWTIRMAEARYTGVMNATGCPTTLGKLFTECREVFESAVRLTWVSEEFLTAQKVGYWMELPLALPASDYPMMQVDIGRASDAGLTFRPVAETIADTQAWARGRPDGYQWRAGLAPDKERQLLEQWHGAGDLT